MRSIEKTTQYRRPHPTLYLVIFTGILVFVSLGSIEAQIVGSQKASEEKPTDCEEGRRLIDNAFYELRDEPDSKIIFILHSGDDESDKLVKERGLATDSFCSRRGFSERCITAIGKKKVGFGSMELFVKGKAFATILFDKNKNSICKNPENWDVY